jgi:hypothetical protein
MIANANVRSMNDVEFQWCTDHLYETGPDGRSDRGSSFDAFQKNELDGVHASVRELGGRIVDYASEHRVYPNNAGTGTHLRIVVGFPNPFDLAKWLDDYYECGAENVDDMVQDIKKGTIGTNACEYEMKNGSIFVIEDYRNAN